MLLRGLTWLILFQLFGTALNVLFLPILPGPIIGLLLLFIALIWRGEISDSLNNASMTLLNYLPLLLIPPAVGMMAYVDAITADLWAIVGSLVLSLVVSLGFTGWLMQKLIERQTRRSNDA